MRRRLSLALVAVLVIVAVAAMLYLSPRMQASRRVASTGSPPDTLAATDSAAQVSARQDADTMCFASRIGLPCDPR